MKKLSELDESEKSNIEEACWTSSKIIYDNAVVTETSKFGICNSCKNFQIAESEFNVEFAQCLDFNVRLNQRRPIKTCTSYDKKGMLSLRDMYAMAILIDSPKQKVGFHKGETNEED